MLLATLVFVATSASPRAARSNEIIVSEPILAYPKGSSLGIIDLGNCFVGRGKLDEARRQYILAPSVVKPGEDIDVIKAIAQSKIAESYVAENRLDDAVSAYREAFAVLDSKSAKDEISRQTDGNASLKADILPQLAEIYTRQNRVELAEKTLQQAILILKQSYNYREVFQPMNTLSALYDSQKNTSAALLVRKEIQCFSEQRQYPVAFFDSAYFNDLHARLQLAFVETKAVNSIEGSATLTIPHFGGIPKVETGSQNADFGTALRRILNSIGPLPPLPPSNHSDLVVEVHVFQAISACGGVVTPFDKPSAPRDPPPIVVFMRLHRWPDAQ
jgi:tetratricopeptide (TPR) repeat protein